MKFYCHLKGMKRAGKYEQEKAEIAAVFHENKGRYGYRRITMVLLDRSICLNLRLSGGLMKELDLICRVMMKKYCSYKGEVGKTAPNLLNRDIFAERFNRKRAANVMAFSLFGQEQYLSPILDLHSGYLVSYTHIRTPRSEYGNFDAGQKPQNQGKAEGLAVCDSQTTSPFSCLNNFLYKYLSNFSGALQFGALFFAFFIRLDSNFS